MQDFYHQQYQRALKEFNLTGGARNSWTCGSDVYYRSTVGYRGSRIWYLVCPPCLLCELLSSELGCCNKPHSTSHLRGLGFRPSVPPRLCDMRLHFFFFGRGAPTVVEYALPMTYASLHCSSCVGWLPCSILHVESRLR